MAADNKSLGRFDLQGIPPAPRGVPQIEVTFDIDANGIVSVTAKDKATSKEQQIRIQASAVGFPTPTSRRWSRTPKPKAEDEKRKALVEASNQGDALVHSTEKALSEHGDKVGAAEKTAIETAAVALKEALKADDIEDIKAKTNTLAQASMKLGEAMYKAARPKAPPPTRPQTARRRRTTMSWMPTSRRSTTTRSVRLTVHRPFRQKERRGFSSPSGARSSFGAMNKRCYYETLECEKASTPTRSNPPIASWRCSFIPTAIPATHTAESSSRKSTRPMTS